MKRVCVHGLATVILGSMALAEGDNPQVKPARDPVVGNWILYEIDDTPARVQFSFRADGNLWMPKNGTLEKYGSWKRLAGAEAAEALQELSGPQISDYTALRVYRVREELFGYTYIVLLLSGHTLCRAEYHGQRGMLEYYVRASWREMSRRAYAVYWRTPEEVERMERHRIELEELKANRAQ